MSSLEDRREWLPPKPPERPEPIRSERFRVKGYQRFTNIFWRYLRGEPQLERMWNSYPQIRARPQRKVTIARKKRFAPLDTYDYFLDCNGIVLDAWNDRKCGHGRGIDYSPPYQGKTRNRPKRAI